MLTENVKISWSGCKDSQTSADTVEAGKATGAMSYVSDASDYRLFCCTKWSLQAFISSLSAPKYSSAQLTE